MRLTENEQKALSLAEEHDKGSRQYSQARPRGQRIPLIAYSIAYPFDRGAMFDKKVEVAVRRAGSIRERFRRLLRLREDRRSFCEAVRW